MQDATTHDESACPVTCCGVMDMDTGEWSKGPYGSKVLGAVRGGQDRSSEETESSAVIAAACFASIVVIGIIVALVRA